MLQLQQFISLGVLVLALSAKSVAGRAFGIGEEEDVFAQPHTAIDLNSTNFDQYLGQLPPQQWCLIEFYAAWCPHCRSVSCGFGLVPCMDKLRSCMHARPSSHTRHCFSSCVCPCRHYAPVFEKISNFMKGLASQGGPAVFVGRMDCAKEVSAASSS
jgi:thiol-disulfide isomerase/thioredoxin